MFLPKLSFCVVALAAATFCQAQKTISQGTIVYSISTQSTSGTTSSDPLKGATNTIYLKGGLSRVDMASPLGKETTLLDDNTGAGAILKEYSGQKLMITLSKDNWISQNKKFEGLSFETAVAPAQKIDGYTCNKATATLKDGSVMTVYYSPDITLINKAFNPVFQQLQGLPVQYEFASGKLKFTYTLSSINLDPVAVSTFDLPKSGYRVMTYEESHQAKP